MPAEMRQAFAHAQTQEDGVPILMGNLEHWGMGHGSWWTNVFSSVCQILSRRHIPCGYIESPRGIKPQLPHAIQPDETLHTGFLFCLVLSSQAPRPPSLSPRTTSQNK